MVEPITFAELVQKIQHETITMEEVSAYFLEKPPVSPLRLEVALNEALVDVSGVERAARDSASSMASAATRIAGSNELERAGAPKPDGTMLAIGDSWFKLPPWQPRTIIDFLRPDFPIINLAHWGDTLEQTIMGGHYMPYLQTKKVKYLLVSGGGDDLLAGGEFYKYINLFDPDHTRPSDAAYYLNSEFYKEIEYIKTLFLNLNQQVIATSPHAKILVHGYDYAIPSVDGPWLGSPMVRQGFDINHHPGSDLAQAIVRLAIDVFNQMLIGLAGGRGGRPPYGSFIYVDLRGQVDPDHWANELHPDEFAARKMAALFAAKLRAPLVAEHREERRAVPA